MLICALLMLLVVRRRERVMTVDAFITMALLASLSLVLFGAFPTTGRSGPWPSTR